MKNIKMHVISKYFYPVNAGIENNMLNTYGYMAKRGWDITIHVSKNTLTQKNILPSVEKIEGIKVRRYFSGKFGFRPKIDWDKIDVLVIKNFNVFPHFQILMNCLLKKFLRRKKFTIILETHGGFTPDWNVFGKRTKIIKKIYHRVLGVILVNLTVDEIRAVSEWEKKEMKKIGINTGKITVIQNGIENYAFANLEKLASDEVKTFVAKSKPYMIQIGRIHPIKNYETAIIALISLPKKFNYLIVGPEENPVYKEKLVRLITNLKLNNRVKFIGEARGVDKYYLMKNAELMVHMASWESFCNSIHEGMSQGLVCVVSNSTALPYLVKEGINGFSVNTYDVHSLVKKIKLILNKKNKNVVKKIKKTNQISARNKTWQKISVKVESLYIKAIDQQYRQL